MTNNARPTGAALLARRIAGPFTRAIADENILVFLLIVRWLSLLPPLATLLRNPQPDITPFLVLGVALLINIVLSLWHAKIDAWLIRRPVLLGFDLALVAVFLALTGGSSSSYYFYATTPLLAAAFFFQIRGGLAAAAALTPLYLLALFVAQKRTGAVLDDVEAFSELLSFYGIAVTFGYPSVLLNRLRTASTQLQRTQSELARAETLATLGNMVAHVGHEIRNPLSVLGGYAHRMARKPEDVESVRRHALVIAGEVKRLEELLNELLDFSRPAKPDLRLENLHAILDQACLLSGHNPGSSPVTLVKDYDSALPQLCVNASSLLRAFLNVIQNAIQFMPDGGTLTITTCTVSDEVLVTIADTGPGIAPEVLPTIFTPFVTHRPRGTGLGLSVTKQVIEHHGGRIEVRSEEGKGTTFIFHLPSAQPACAESTPH